MTLLQCEKKLTVFPLNIHFELLEIRVSQNLVKLGGVPIRGGRTGEK